MALLVDEGGEHDDDLGEAFDAHGGFNVFLVVDQLADHFDFVDDVLPVTVVFSLCGDVLPQLLENGGNLEGVDPFLEEPGEPVLKVGEGGVGVVQVGFHDALHDHEVDFVEGSLVVAAVVEGQADVDVVEADLFVQVQAEDVEVDGEHHLYLFEEGEEVFFSDGFFVDLSPRVQPVAVLENVGEIEDGESFVM